MAADAGDGEPEPSQLVHHGLVGPGPDDLGEDAAAVRPLDLEVVELVGGVLHPGPQAPLLGLAAEPQPAGVAAADPAEVLAGEPEDRAVVDHPAGVVAHGRVDDLAVGEPAHVAGDAGLQQQLGVGARHLVLAQRRQVDDRRGLPAGPVLGDGAVAGVGPGQPVAVVLGEVAGEPGGAGVEAGLLGELGLRVGGHAEGGRFLEHVRAGVDANLDVGRVPPVGRVDVAGAGGGDAHQVLQRPQQHVVAGPRPGLVEEDLVGTVEVGVVEEVDRRPAPPGGHAVGGPGPVDVVGAVGVAGEPHLLVVAGGAGGVEGVVAADGVLHHLHQRLHLGVVELRVEAGGGAGRAHEGAGDGGVEAVGPAPV